MTAIAPFPPAAPAPDEDKPRTLDSGIGGSDRTFQVTATGVGTFVLVVTGAIGLFLGYQLLPTIDHFGFGFFIRHAWSPTENLYGISGVLLGTVEVAVIALAISFPLALLSAIYISEYSPNWLKGTLVAAIDLMAAVPSIIYGLWGLLLIEPHAIFVSRWLNANFGWLPWMKVDTDPRAAVLSPHEYLSSPFLAALIVSMMVIPMACAVMRGVFAQAPIGEREAAYALGSTRWGMIRSVVLPFGRGGIIGGTMLALGRALGETVAVVLILSQEPYIFRVKPLQLGGSTVASLIANNFNDAGSAQLSALLAAGFVLFAMTIAVNTIAAIFVNRGRSGAQTEI